MFCKNAYYAARIEIKLGGTETAAIQLVSAPTIIVASSIVINIGPQFQFGKI